MRTSRPSMERTSAGSSLAISVTLGVRLTWANTKRRVWRCGKVSSDGVFIRVGYRVDMLVGNAVLVELKTAKKLHPIHEAQLLSYLKLSNRRLGLLIPGCAGFACWPRSHPLLSGAGS